MASMASPVNTLNHIWVLLQLTNTCETETVNLSTTYLTKLQLLDLSGNDELGNKIIPNVSWLPALKHLKLGDTGLTGQIVIHDIEAIENLVELDLSQNRITGFVNNKGTTRLSTRLSKLEQLNLGSNPLDNSILSALSGLSSLKHLKLAKCGLKLTGQIELRGTMNLSTSLAELELIDLSRNELTNHSLSTLSRLPSLRHLILQENSLGQIQLHDIEAIKNLEELDLSFCAITGFVSYTGCGQMQKLKRLYLTGNELRTLPSCWANLSSLQKLDVSYNQITGNIATSPLIHLHSLEVLLLSENKFEIPHSFKAFANHTKLKYFDADSNHVILDDSEQDVHQLAQTHGFQLEVLVLSNCGLITYPPIIHHQYNLRFIDLSHNSLKGDFPTWLLENNQQLEAIFIRNNSLTGVLQLPSFPHTHLSIIDVAENKLNGNIPLELGATLSRLNLLDMSNNEFEGDIPPSLCDIQPLRYLYLSDNQLSGGLDNLTEACFNLHVLALSSNKLEGELSSFYGFSSLWFLDLQGNNFNGSIEPNMFSPSLESLQVLNLSNNSLEGPIPEDFCSLRELHVLDLSYNNLNGSVPFCFHNLSEIQYIFLNNNKLSGQMTNAFQYALSLITLDLSYNALTGEIATYLANSSTQSALLLRGNQFHGQIPAQLCTWDSLNMLDLSHNCLTGPIPPCLGNKTLVSSYSFFGHDYRSSSIIGLEDIIKETRGFISISPRYRLYDIENHINFTTKSMSYNYEGQILQLMYGIDLSCNRLGGQIPLGIGKLSDLHGLNLSHNNFWGSIPTTLSNLKNIESLDLSYNSLNGSIPTELLELDTLGVFKVAYNNLSGQIPNNAHFTTFDASSYEGNPLLCGFPLSKNCTACELPSPAPSRDSDDFKEGWMDMETFYLSFAASATTMFLAVLVILWINPHWSNMWFYFAKTCVLASCCFVEDNIRRLRRAGNA
ncbi:hypothetical protein Cgig2_027841 [Carnegiea gigantea]|uniref:Toll-like receptor 3 n=1 Tax=Carnegiea gigantea TaxID=171969 RepID=A0A9Q1QAG5_9CARY|nr:hypothetical protein Cgig2_027841 [Carnegiea gigantea]